MPLPAVSKRTRLQAWVIGLCALAVLVTSLSLPYPFAWEYRLQDTLLRAETSQPLPKDLAIVAIDAPSLELSAVEPSEVEASPALQLMQAGFPWSREVYALLIEKLREAGARMVVFDMTFPSPASRGGDEEFARALAAQPERVAIAANFDLPSAPDGSMKPLYLPPVSELGNAAGDRVGLANLAPSDDGIVREAFPHATASSIAGESSLPGEVVRPSLAAVVIRQSGGNPPPESEIYPCRFRFFQPGSAPVYSLYELFVPAFWQSNLRKGAVFKDKIVLIGATAATMQDYHLTPVGRLSGPEVQLHVLAAMRSGAWLNAGNKFLQIAGIFLAAAGIFSLACVRRNPFWFAAGWLGGIVLWAALCWGALHFASFFLPMVAPLVTWLLCGFAGLICDVSTEQMERRRLRKQLERYVSREVVKEIVDNPTSYLQTLGGVRKDVVVLFCDLKGFTPSAEGLDPADLLTMLNDYFGDMVSVVFAHHGMLDKFMGDALMTLWGGMSSAGAEEDARRAVRAAVAMKARLQEINARRLDAGLKPWSCGIGLSQGPAVFGHIGSHEQMALTVIGDTVNLASRMEGLTRQYGCDILIDERLARLVGEEFALLEVDTARVKGRTKPERFFYPYAKDQEEAQTSWAAAFQEARAFYRQGDFAAAREKFAALDWDFLPSLVSCYLRRCEDLLAHPPSEPWDGIWDFVSK